MAGTPKVSVYAMFAALYPMLSIGVVALPAMMHTNTVTPGAMLKMFGEQFGSVLDSIGTKRIEILANALLAMTVLPFSGSRPRFR
jgi:hypothetical protein